MARLQAPRGKAGEFHLHGRTFIIDKKGQVDIPDEFISSKLWADGFTVVPAKTEVLIPEAPVLIDKKGDK